MAYSEREKGHYRRDIDAGKELDLFGKVAIVTGASRGIGRSIALRLALQGANLVITSQMQSEIQAKSVVSEIQSLDRQAIWIPGDATEEETAKDVVEKTIKQFGQIDILVNNVGTTRDSLVVRMKKNEWKEVLSTNLDSAFYMTRAVLPFMSRQRNGAIVNISSVAGQIGNPGQANYAAAKAGLEAFTKSAAMEYAKRGIRINAIALGLIETVLTQGLTKEQKQSILEKTPMRRAILPEEAAKTVLFLVSDLSSGITGQIINVDGGMVRK